MRDNPKLKGSAVVIVGAGAVGAVLAHALDRAGARVSLVARGAHLEAIQQSGLSLDGPEGRQTLRLRADSDPAALGPQDYIVLCVKSHSLEALAPSLTPMLHPGSTVIAALNGIPWWYFQGLDGPHRNRRIASLDPRGVIASALPAASVVGCVLHFAAQIEAPGLVRLNTGNRIILGEPGGAETERLLSLSEAFRAGGLEVDVSTRIRDDIWTKLIGNASANPIAAITRQTPGVIFSEPELRTFARDVMAEAAAVAQAYGARLTMSLDKRLDLGRSIGNARPSMLQDRDHGRPLELNSIVDAVVELGEVAGCPTPLLRALAVLARATVAADRRSTEAKSP